MTEVVKEVRVLKVPVAYEDLTAAGLAAKMAELELKMTDAEKEVVGEYFGCRRRTTMTKGDVPGWQDPLGYEPDRSAFSKAEELEGAYPQLSFAFLMASELVRAQNGWDMQSEFIDDLKQLNLDLQLSGELFGAVAPFVFMGLVVDSKENG